VQKAHPVLILHPLVHFCDTFNDLDYFDSWYSCDGRDTFSSLVLQYKTLQENLTLLERKEQVETNIYTWALNTTGENTTANQKSSNHKYAWWRWRRKSIIALSSQLRVNWWNTSKYICASRIRSSIETYLTAVLITHTTKSYIDCWKWNF
jgi:hypothetical protein